VSTLTGLRRLIGLVIRRDRVRLPVWILAVCAFVVGSAASLPPLYPDQESIDDYARLFGDNPALVAFAGPGYGFDDPNIGVILVNETQLWACVAAALMSIFLVNRHTRVEEDAERTELLRSSVVGRHAPTAAAVTVVAGADLVVGAVCAAGFVALDYPVTGSLALAGSFATCGLFFTGLTAVVAQAAGGSRSTLGLSSAALGAAFAVRAVGDIGDNVLRWLSPIGWVQGVRAYAGERWWTLLVVLVASVLLVVAAFALSTVRDVGSGLLPQRPGPRVASPGLGRPLGLALRLQRGSLVGWCVGLFLTGVVYGSIGQDVEEMIEENPTYADFLAQAQGASLTDSYLATSMSMLALLAAGFAVSATLRLRSEESAGRAEPVLAAPVGRARWAASHLLVAGVGTVLVVASAGLGVGLSYAVVTGDAGEVGRMVGAALVTVPAVLVLAGVAALLFGIAPRWALLAWAGLAVSVLVELFGELLRLPEWTRSLSPLHHVPALPADELAVLPLVALVALAGVLVAFGLGGFRARDLQTE
jgi:ABC-2 type transport system permease protein